MTKISFEFYPPKTEEQRTQLDRAAAKLREHAPEYVSCTFGAGGSTLSYTSETVRHLSQHHGFEAAPHLSCVGGNREEIRELLKLYRAIGCRRIVALRGDLPSGMGHPGDLRYASEPWRPNHPKLTAWFEAFSQNPGIAETAPRE